MTLEHIRQIMSRLQISMEENRLTAIIIGLAILVALIIFGGLMIDMFLDRRQQRQKAKAVERLHKHLESLPSSES